MVLGLPSRLQLHPVLSRLFPATLSPQLSPLLQLPPAVPVFPAGRQSRVFPSFPSLPFVLLVLSLPWIPLVRRVPCPPSSRCGLADPGPLSRRWVPAVLSYLRDTRHDVIFLHSTRRHSLKIHNVRSNVRTYVTFVCFSADNTCD